MIFKLIGMSQCEGFPEPQKKLLELVDYSEPFKLKLGRETENGLQVICQAVGGLIGFIDVPGYLTVDRLYLARVRYHPYYPGNPGFDISTNPAEPFVAVRKDILANYGMQWEVGDRLHRRLEVVGLARHQPMDLPGYVPVWA